MNVLIIILGIIVILLAYYIYTIVTAIPSLADNIDLTKPPIVVKATSITNPYSINYTISVWIYVANFPQNNQIETFLSYGFTPYIGPTSSLWTLQMDTMSPAMYCNILTTTGDGSNSYQQLPITITDSFPLQKWVYVTTVVSNNLVEVYLNGRFISVNSIDPNSEGITVFVADASLDPTNGPTFTFGAQGTMADDGSTRTNGSPIVLTHLSRWDYPLAAGDVYNVYHKGNGQESNIWGPAYHLNINLAQGNNNYTLPVF
jgi:hypothetical protein